MSERAVLLCDWRQEDVPDGQFVEIHEFLERAGEGAMMAWERAALALPDGTDILSANIWSDGTVQVVAVGPLWDRLARWSWQHGDHVFCEGWV